MALTFAEDRQLTDRAIEVTKFRHIYRYSYDDEYFYFLWKKGKRTLAHDRYPLNEMSADLEQWRGRPSFMATNIKRSIGWLLLSVVAFISTSSPLDSLMGVLALMVSLLFLFRGIDWFFPFSATILSYQDNSGCVYMLHGDKETEEWSAFEKGLSGAINAAKNMRI